MVSMYCYCEVVRNEQNVRSGGEPLVEVAVWRDVIRLHPDPCSVSMASKANNSECKVFVKVNQQMLQKKAVEFEGGNVKRFVVSSMDTFNSHSDIHLGRAKFLWKYALIWSLLDLDR